MKLSQKNSDSLKETMKEKEKLTILEYEENYSQKENGKRASKIFNLVLVALGVIILAGMFSFFKDVYDINVYAGYVVGVICLVVFVIAFIIPVVKLKKQDRFNVNVSVYTAKKAKKHNDKVRQSLAEKIIDVYLKADCTWYDSQKVQKLILATEEKDKQGLKTALNEIYSQDVTKASRDLIFKSAVKSGTYSAISQKDYTDALLVTAINLQMIKDITFLYGFRPSDTKLIKIFSKVISNSLVAYGLGSSRAGSSVVKTLGGVVKGIPLLGSAISVLVDSSVQGLSNGVLTLMIGRQTVSYLKKEYNLQNVLDGVEIGESDEDFVKICDGLKTALITQGKDKTKTA